MKMAPVGLMWGNDPAGAPLTESWINPAAPTYARAHLGVEGRLNGPVDNPASACMSCHSTAQAPALAPMLPTAACAQPPFRADWFRNLRGTTAFGRRQARGGACQTDASGITITAADYSLQLSSTVARALPSATGGQTYAQMGRFIGTDGKPTSDEKLAAVDAKTGKPVENGLRNMWVSETALTTALNTAYFAESVATFAIVMGIALLRAGIGFAVLTFQALAPAEARGKNRAPSGAPVPSV
jgi:hypothetical protein